MSARSLFHWLMHDWTPWSEVQAETVVYAFFNPQQRPTRRRFQTRKCSVCGQIEEREV